MSSPNFNIEVVQGDITRQSVDVIVNAANESLLGGGGVDGAIHRAAGSELLAECSALSGCPTGEARITHGYQLAARHVIHTVGPVWHGGGSGEAALLTSCYETSLRLAEENRLASIAFPAISTGIFGYPPAAAARVAVDVVSQFPASSLKLARFVCFDPATAEIYQACLGDAKPGGR